MCEMEKKIDKKVKSVSIWSVEYYNAAFSIHSSPLPITTSISHLLLLLSSFGRLNRIVLFSSFSFSSSSSLLGQFPNIIPPPSMVRLICLSQSVVFCYLSITFENRISGLTVHRLSNNITQSILFFYFIIDREYYDKSNFI